MPRFLAWGSPFSFKLFSFGRKQVSWMPLPDIRAVRGIPHRHLTPVSNADPLSAIQSASNFVMNFPSVVSISSTFW